MDKEHTVTSKPASNRGSGYRPQAASLLLVLIIGLSGGFIGAAIQDRTDSNVISGSLSDQKKIVTNESELFSTIAKQVGGSVVSVNTSVTNQGSNDALSRFYGLDTPRQQQGAGTGIIINKAGLVLTNRHVVPAGTTTVSITLSDGTELTDVSVVGRTSDTDSLDIAILKIGNKQGHTLTPAVLGDSAKVAVGDQVVAIGNALGQFQNTVTSGIVSGYGRSITAGSSSGDDEAENLDNLFQTDAAINEGNSGGPLMNLNGQVIGINTAVASDSQNIGFSIPINDVKGLIEHVIKTGKFERPYLGVRYVSLTADLAKEYKLPVEQGAYIVPATGDQSPSVISGGAADKAGLRGGDIITRVGGKAIDSHNNLTSLLGQYQPGDRVKIVVRNGDDTRSVDVTLGTAPAS